ncbi:putative multidrug resistance protein EmrK [bacterium BMS3Abin07]|nr:putative multidrug resistance protein EmrK [bacterium BMS3Abin07]GBE31805.1 putative multidrug resistance protein EmrK [bacterium BMS3Bbin05]HDL21078.1 HlyD family secretion protein [Nitrospirota bacterium]HDO21879.1 HlyD family secretion protein [Nitrospirota bacterium]HDZ87533.1 HlyD family secretion protein [Nitrospirota bacterium]
MSEDSENRTGNHRKRFIVLAIFASVLFISLLAGFFYVRYRNTHISTDDAYIKGTIHTVASKVSGTVLKIYTADNRYVKKGDLLLQLDPETFQERVDVAEARTDSEKARLESLKSRLITTRKTLTQLKTAVAVADAEMDVVKAKLINAEKDYGRADRLMKESVIPVDKFENIKTEYDVIVARSKASQKQIEQAGTAVETQKAVISEIKSNIKAQKEKIRGKIASLKLARISLSYTRICAPSDGYVTKKAVESGNQVQPGQPLMAVVPLNDVYIVANYKETKVGSIKPGQRVKIKVDAYPGRAFYGRVGSIMAGTGSSFSLFPPENATGNYVKVVQRIPVKIILEKETDPEHLLRIGMSVIPTVYTK